MLRVWLLWPQAASIGNPVPEATICGLGLLGAAGLQPSSGGAVKPWRLYCGIIACRACKM